MRLLLLLLPPLLLLAGVASAVEVTPSEYRHRLTVLADRLAAADTPGSKDAAATLVGLQVRWSDGVLPADPGIPALVQDGKTGAARSRVRALLTALDHLDAPVVRVDTRELTALTDRLPRALDKGGELMHPDLAVPAPAQTWVERMQIAVSWLIDRLSDFWAWLKSWFTVKPTDSSGGFTVLLTCVFAGLAALLILFILLALRRQRIPEPPTPIARPANAADHDPTSRPADGWIVRARELAASGRHREAVRAWYHAVLAAAFAAGHLRHRTGRTNWEYVAALPPGATWRAGFIALTGRFDRVWYGDHGDAGDASAAGAEAEDLLTALEAR